MTTRLVCGACRRELPVLSPRVQCSCGGLLEVLHEPKASGPSLRSRFDRRRVSDPVGQGSGVWRFRELLLPGRFDPVTHPEGNTPLYRRDPVARYTGLVDLALKHEGENPTLSFKDRGMSAGVSWAHHLGVRQVACASTGDTSAA
ncbi:MAG TPA: pyridoxal-phosphate dependent enzyme, partial [Vicinamibacteria bacterium]